MKDSFYFLLLFVCLVGMVFCFNQDTASLCNADIVQNTYFGPKTPRTGNQILVRVQILIHDSPDPSGVQISQVNFNGQNIPLKPRDVSGFRGEGSFQVPPGTYDLVWVVERDKLVWPRQIDHEEVVTISPRDLWIQLSIVGETVSIR